MEDGQLRSNALRKHAIETAKLDRVSSTPTSGPSMKNGATVSSCIGDSSDYEPDADSHRDADGREVTSERTEVDREDPVID